MRGGITVKDYSFGIPKALAGHFFNNVVLHTPLVSSNIRSKEPYVSTIDRGDLGAYMAKEAKSAGAEVRVNSEVKEIFPDHIQLESGEKFFFKYLIGADGSNSVVRKYLKLKNNKEAIAIQYKISKIYPRMELFFDANFFGSGYAWIFPHKNYTAIGCGADPDKLIKADDLKNNFSQWLQKMRIDINDTKLESWLINYDYQGHEFGNVYLVGDAGGFTSGLTGEGIFYAMISGEEVARKIIDPQYPQNYLHKILKIKRNHEKLLSTLCKNKTLTQLLYNLGGILFITGLFDKKLINNYS